MVEVSTAQLLMIRKGMLIAGDKIAWQFAPATLVIALKLVETLLAESKALQ